MIIKYIDELFLSDRWDIKSEEDVSVYLIELKGFSQDKGLAQWEIVGESYVSRKLLHYDDTADGSNALNGSWREFYANERALGCYKLYRGSSIFYKDSLPIFRGLAKAIIYLRYSQGFMRWIKSFDLSTADKIKTEIPFFERLIVNQTTKKLIDKWDSFKSIKGKWTLPVVCTLSDDTKIVFGLTGKENDDWKELKDLNVNIERSLELMEYFSKPDSFDKEIVSTELQMAKGQGRNAFGKGFSLDEISDSEYTRLLGGITKTNRKNLLNVWAERLEYKIKVVPNPDTSALIFIPEGTLKYSELKSFVDSENYKKEIYWKAKKTKAETDEDSQATISITPTLIPIPVSSQATLFLVNIEGTTKKKYVIQQIFPGVSLDYLVCLNHEILHSSIQYSIVGYMKAALICQNSDAPCIYKYWTEIFTSALQKNYIYANEIFYSFQRFCKAFTEEDLVAKGKARDYFWVISRIRRLQHLIHIARTKPNELITSNFQNNLINIEKYEYTEKGVFHMIKECPETAKLVGSVYDILWDWQKEKINAFIKQAWQGVPNDEFALFTKGALTGMLLNEMTYCVTNAGRRFSVTQGRHPSTLRGEQIVSLVAKGVGLLVNLQEENRFNCNTLPFINSCVEDSRKDTFNSGMIMGLVFIFKKN